MSDRPCDVVIWGATGFTGSLATAYLAGDPRNFFSCSIDQSIRNKYGTTVKYGLAGRNREKLEALKRDCGCAADVPLFVAAADDEKAIATFVRQTRVVCSTAGPFVKYSDNVVKACAKLGTDYVDITGEVPWVRSIMDRFHDRAVAEEVAICNM